MTSKEKAKELISKFMPHVRWKLSQEDCMDRAKECALIAVELRFEADFKSYSIEYGEDSLEYWELVKHEINNYANRI